MMPDWEKRQRCSWQCSQTRTSLCLALTTAVRIHCRRVNGVSEEKPSDVDSMHESVVARNGFSALGPWTRSGKALKKHSLASFMNTTACAIHCGDIRLYDYTGVGFLMIVIIKGQMEAVFVTTEEWSELGGKSMAIRHPLANTTPPVLHIVLSELSVWGCWQVLGLSVCPLNLLGKWPFPAAAAPLYVLQTHGGHRSAVSRHQSEDSSHN